MKLISSGVFFQKRIFPLIWFGFLAVFTVISLYHVIESREFHKMAFILAPAIMATLGYIFFKNTIFDLMDEVWDAGDVLIAKKKDKEEHILLSDIMNVSYSNFSSPQRVTLTLRKPCYWGTEVSFIPVSARPFKKNPIVQDLIERVDAKRRC